MSRKEGIYTLFETLSFLKHYPLSKFESPEDFIKALEEYIDYYNNKRIKSRLKGKGLSKSHFISKNSSVTPCHLLYKQRRCW